MRKSGARVLKQTDAQGPVLYFMHRDQRVQDNWALLYAQSLAITQKQPLIVFFCVPKTFLDMSYRQYDFMLGTLESIRTSLSKKNIPFVLSFGSPEKELIALTKKIAAGTIITDFSPLHIVRQWHKQIQKQTNVTYIEVDAHNIVPCWVASNKQEFAARTFRPKIQRLLSTYLTEFPTLKKHPYILKKNLQSQKVETIRKKLSRDVSPISWIQPGEEAAKKALKHCVEKTLRRYDEQRNDPTKNAQSDLSPYLHFGHISSARIALEVKKSTIPVHDKQAFLEELIVRKELSDNYCFYNEQYDSFSGIAHWAKETIQKHISDPREYIYTKKQFEQAKTHDPLWNAAQKQLLETGKIHGYMRMYWAKKILEWTKKPETAFRIALYLNDTYSIDGNDPNGYVGVAWSIGGVHDRAWFERPIFGKIRYMNANGCKRKFDVDAYIDRYL